jgi:hypothetical protein
MNCTDARQNAATEPRKTDEFEVWTIVKCDMFYTILTFSIHTHSDVIRELCTAKTKRTNSTKRKVQVRNPSMYSF